MPTELIIIILGCLVMGAMLYRDDYKRKKEQELSDKLWGRKK